MMFYDQDRNVIVEVWIISFLEVLSTTLLSKRQKEGFYMSLQSDY